MLDCPRALTTTPQWLRARPRRSLCGPRYMCARVVVPCKCSQGKQCARAHTRMPLPACEMYAAFFFSSSAKGLCSGEARQTHTADCHAMGAPPHVCAPSKQLACVHAHVERTKCSGLTRELRSKQCGPKQCSYVHVCEAGVDSACMQTCGADKGVRAMCTHVPRHARPSCSPNATHATHPDRSACVAWPHGPRVPPWW